MHIFGGNAGAKIWIDNEREEKLFRKNSAFNLRFLTLNVFLYGVRISAIADVLDPTGDPALHTLILLHQCPFSRYFQSTEIID